jgi:hypothetical protein
MAGNDSSISPYLLRPLRSLEQVLGGRSRAAESTRDNIESTPPCSEQGSAEGRGRDALRPSA